MFNSVWLGGAVVVQLTVYSYLLFCVFVAHVACFILCQNNKTVKLYFFVSCIVHTVKEYNHCDLE